jgi:hypothetical protein
MAEIVDVYEMIDDGGGLTGWYAKGNHTLEEMVEGIKWEYGDDYFDEDDFNEGGRDKYLKVVHEYMRCVPVPRDSDLPFAHWLVACKKGRGAFECSTIYL